MISTSFLRSGWVKPLLLAVLAAAGLGAGLYFGSDATSEKYENSVLERATHRFPLSPADAKDALEAPVVTADASGRLYLAWASRTGENERTLYLVRSDDAGTCFDEPRVMAKSGVFKAVAQMKGKTVVRELRMVPHLASAGGTVHLAWTESVASGNGVRMVTASSTNRGDAFAMPKQIHHGADARPTFTALFAGGDGSLLASWLDNRNKTQQCYSAFRPAGGGEFSPETIVHAGDDEKGVCPCCPTSSLLASDGTAFVAFRNVADGFRDIAIGVRKPGAGSFEIHPVVPPTWEFKGCPHDGPSLALVGEMLHVVWMDARTGCQRCYHAHARVSNMKFSAQELHPLPIGTQGNAKLHVDSAGTLHAVWEESPSEPAAEKGHRHEPEAPKPGTGGRSIMHRAWASGATNFGEAKAIQPATGAFQTRPALTSVGSHVVAAWNELDENGKAVVIARIGETGGGR